MREKLAKYQKQRPPSSKAPMPQLSQLKSQAFRPKEEAKVEEEQTAEEDARLTTEEITKGVQKAKESLNAPPLDLAAFEEALKKKHDELKQAGITPVLQIPKPKFKVGISKVAKKNR